MGGLKRIGVVGAGNMGAGIAQKTAQEGLDVVLVDIKDEFVSRGLENIRGLLNEGVERKIFTPEHVEAVMGRITGTTDLAALADCDLIIEAVFEDEDVKSELFANLDKLCQGRAILATNTSSFKVTDLAKAVDHAEKFVGLHFFYHPAKNRLLEIIPGRDTSQKTLDESFRYAGLTGKTAIAVGDAPGFAVNRFFVPWLNEAVRMLDEGFCDIPTIDEAAKKAFRIGMGPFMLMNVTGPPITYHSTRTLGDELGPFYGPAAGLKPLIDSGGTWDLEGEPDESKFETVADRLLGVVFLVASQIIDEDVATMTDTDIGAKVGLRWAQGPFEMMNRMGIDRAYGLVKTIVDRYDDRSMPASIQAKRDAGKNWDIRYVVRADRDGVAYITLNRPEAMNALNETVVGQLAEEFDAANGDDAVKSIVIRGAGKAFIAGADIGFFIKNIKADTLQRTYDFTDFGQELLKRIDNSPKLIIAKVDGLALGGGAEIALACDTIVATPGATMGFPETGIGIYPGLGGTQRTARYVGPELAKYLVFTGKVLSAKRAGDIGLIEYVVELAEIDGFIHELATSGEAVTKASRGPVEPSGDWVQIKSWFGPDNVAAMIDGSAMDDSDPVKAKTAKTISFKAPVAVRLANQIIDEGSALPLDEGLKREMAHLIEVFSTEDALEGLTSLGRKRPEYKGK